MKRRRQARRPDRRLPTRQRLLTAAGQEVARSGVRGASVDAIAAGAGVTTGAIYSNFAGKDGLLDALTGAVLEARLARDRRHFSGDGSERLRARADAWVKESGRSQSDVVLFFESWSEALRDPILRPRVAESWHELRRVMRGAIQLEASRVGVKLTAAAAEDLAMVALALAHGIAMEKALTPRAVPDGILGLALSLLFRALGAPPPDAT